MISTLAQRLLVTTAATATVAGFGLHTNGITQSTQNAQNTTETPVTTAASSVAVAPVTATVPAATPAAPSPAPVVAAESNKPSASDFAPDFPFHGPAFSRFVADSYRQTGDSNADAQQAAPFYRWIHDAYQQRTKRIGPLPGVGARPTLVEGLDAERAHIAAIADPAAKTQAQEQVALWAHRAVKKMVPHFSLNHGFEFYNMANRGERQCLAQSVLVASLLQRAGVPTGVVMVWKSLKGEESNNGHCVAVAQLANGRHILVDASDKTPFARQQGLFLPVDGKYEYVLPQYTTAAGPSEIVGYTRRANGESVALADVTTMDIAFLNSQFDYYRGERAPGGIFAKAKTPSGLAESAEYLRQAITDCPDNPLAVYMLGNVYERLGKLDQARTQFAQAHEQYDRSGYIPQGEQDAYKRVHAETVQVSLANSLK